jgi:toxin ParE1/3/4
VSGFKLSRRAARDLVEIGAFGIRNFGETQAAAYHADLLRTFDLLAEFPLMARARAESRHGFRAHVHGSHYIIYLVRRDHIWIARILRTEVDLARRLKSLD